MLSLTQQSLFPSSYLTNSLVRSFAVAQCFLQARSIDETVKFVWRATHCGQKYAFVRKNYVTRDAMSSCSGDHPLVEGICADYTPSGFLETVH